MSNIFSRKGFELAISTLVVMILGIIIVSGGIVLMTKLITSSVNTVGERTQKQQDELNMLMTEGQLVAVVPATQKISAGDTATIGLGIENKLDDDKTFDILVEGKDKDENPIFWTINYLKKLDVKRNMRRNDPVITVKIPRNAPAGTYTFLVTVKVQGEAEPYDSVRVFTIRVQ